MQLVALLAVFFCLLPAALSAGDVTGLVSVGGKSSADAVIWLEIANPPDFAQSSKVVIDQRNLRFAPRVLAVRVGTAVDFPNNDKVFHNVFSFRDGKKFDLQMYPTGTSKRIVFDRPGLSRIFCNIHPNMAAYVMAVDTPYYAVSDERGAFTITGVPAGTYKYHAWRAGAPELTGSITTTDGHSLDIRW